MRDVCSLFLMFVEYRVTWKIVDCLKRRGAVNFVIPRLCARLSDASTGEHTLLGTATLLRERYLLHRIVNEWRHRHTFVRHVLAAHIHNVPQFQTKLYELFLQFCLVSEHVPISISGYSFSSHITYTSLSEVAMHTAQLNFTRNSERNLTHFVEIVSIAYPPISYLYIHIAIQR